MGHRGDEVPSAHGFQVSGGDGFGSWPGGHCGGWGWGLGLWEVGRVTHKSRWLSVTARTVAPVGVTLESDLGTCSFLLARYLVIQSPVLVMISWCHGSHGYLSKRAAWIVELDEYFGPGGRDGMSGKEKGFFSSLCSRELVAQLPKHGGGPFLFYSSWLH